MRQALLAAILMLAYSSAVLADDDPKESPFAELAQNMSAGMALQYMHYGIAPSLSALSTLKIQDDPEIKRFPSELLKMAKSPQAKDHSVALNAIAILGAIARCSAMDRDKKDIDAVVWRMFAPNSQEFKAALAASLASPTTATRCTAATGLLAFEPNHAVAISILAEGVRSADSKTRQFCCMMIGMLRLSNQKSLDILIGALRQQDPEVRESAANALIRLGHQAKTAVPALIELFQSGNAAYGEHVPYFVMMRPVTKNLALLALAAIGPDAWPAVRAIIKELPRANAEAQVEMLTCLASIGPAAKQSVPLIEQAMRSNASNVQLTAACAMLRVVPGHKKASAIVSDALATKSNTGVGDAPAIKAKDRRSEAIAACEETGPQSAVIVQRLIAILDDENEYTRMAATRALGRMGPFAAAAIPKLEELLIKESSGSQHTFLSHQAAAHALGQLGKASLPALLRAIVPKSGGREYAMGALGWRGRDAAPAVEPLIRILKDRNDHTRAVAAIALGTLGESARAARPALIAIRAEDDHRGRSRSSAQQLHLAVDWALSEIPE